MGLRKGAGVRQLGAVDSFSLPLWYVGLKPHSVEEQHM